MHSRTQRDAIAKAKIGNTERTEALHRLALQAQALERVAHGPSLEQFIASERARSHALGGRTVEGWSKPKGEGAALDVTEERHQLNALGPM